MVPLSYTSPVFDKWSDGFLDSDFRSSEVNTKGRKLGAIRQKEDTFSAPVFEDTFSVMSEDELKVWIVEQDRRGGGMDKLIVHGWDQNGDPSCTCNAETAEHAIMQALQFGKNRVIPCSPQSMYMQIAGPRSGSAVGDALNQSRTVGMLPLDLPERTVAGKKLPSTRSIMGKYADSAHFMTANGYDKSKYKADWKVTAAWFKCDEYYDIKTPLGACTAIARGYPYHYGRDGHSILGVRLALKSGVIYVIYLNSWGSWGETLHGLRSYGLDSPSKYGKGATRYGAHCTCSITVPPWEMAI